jgi:pyruvate dehydrogenase E1 component alpha subunit
MKNTPPKELLLSIYSKLSLLKQNDERMRSIIKSGRMMMPYYSYRGQEAIPATICALLRDSDTISTIYRGTHDMLAKGCPINEFWAELGGRATGTCKGKGGPMHITHPASGMMVCTGIVGSSLPIACGMALASQLRGRDDVTVAFFGDGANNIGAFHESLNLASIWKLPVIFVCSNNLYGEHTKYEETTAIDQIAKRAAAYTMPGFRVNGNDPIELYEVMTDAIERARSGAGPTLIEAMTFRFFGHVFGDNDSYMDPGEKERHAANDPWPNYLSFLLSNGHATQAELDVIDAQHKASIETAIQFALDSPYPETAEISRDVYAYEVAE